MGGTLLDHRRQRERERERVKGAKSVLCRRQTQEFRFYRLASSDFFSALNLEIVYKQKSG
jgi:hypothetical protein